MLTIDRLDDVIADAVVHRFHGGIEGSEAGDDDRREIGLNSKRGLNQVETVRSVQVQVRK